MTANIYNLKPSNFLKTGMISTLEQFDTDHVWHPFDVLHANNILIESAAGVYLHTADGRKIIDAVSSWWVNIHGHAQPDIAKAIYDQAQKLEHVIFSGFTHSPAISLAETLLKILPFSFDQIFYSDNGSTSVEVALKLALQYWYNQDKEKTKIVALEGAYHGDTFGAMALGERSVFTRPFQKFLFDVEFLPLHTGSTQDCIEKFEAIASRGHVAAFIYEPLIQGAAGMVIYDASTLNSLLEIAQKYNILCIADEVMTGFGRTGKLFASEYLALPPDIMCLSKGITGGFMPLGATAINSKVTAQFTSTDKEKRFYHGHSYTANPLSCAAANASMKLLLAEQCQQQIQFITESHAHFLQQIKSHPKIASAKSLGTIISIELKVDGGTSYFSNKRNYFYQFFLDRNILLRPLGNVIYVLPPYIINKSELNKIYGAIAELLEAL